MIKFIHDWVRAILPTREDDQDQVDAIRAESEGLRSKYDPPQQEAAARQAKERWHWHCPRCSSRGVALSPEEAYSQHGSTSRCKDYPRVMRQP